jgi:hypothetical protein
MHTAQVVFGFGNAVGRGGLKVIALFVVFITPAALPAGGVATQEACGFGGFATR